MFRLAALALGFGVLAAAEAGLRLVDAGGPPPFLVTLSEHGRQRLRSVNPSYPKRYFLARHQGRLMASGRMDAHPFLEPASPDPFRIAFVGASTVRGFPHPRSLSAPAFLEAMLADAWPGREVQVFNLGIPALASFAVARVLEDAMRLEPDLVVVYSGHNEYYGIDGAVSRWSPVSNRLRHTLMDGHVPWMLNALLGRVLGTKVTGPDLIQVMGERGSVPLEDRRRQAAPACLAANLSRMTEACRRAQVPVILCTVASNDAGFAPAGSADPGLPARQQSTWQTGLVSAAEALLQDGAGPEAAAGALARLEGAEALAGGSAWLQYLKGRALVLLDRADEARSAFARARELDTMPWRAPDSHNRAIRAAAAESGAVLADMDRAFEEAAPPEGVGWGLMVDHVHPSIAGQILMARAIVAAMAEVPAAVVPPVDGRRLQEDDQYRRTLGDLAVLRWQVDHNMAQLLASPPLDRYNAHSAIRFRRLAGQQWRQLTRAEQQGVVEGARHAVDVPLVLKVADRLFAAEDMSRAQAYYAASRRQAPFTAVGGPVGGGPVGSGHTPLRPRPDAGGAGAPGGVPRAPALRRPGAGARSVLHDRDRGAVEGPVEKPPAGGAPAGARGRPRFSRGARASRRGSARRRAGRRSSRPSPRCRPAAARCGGSRCRGTRRGRAARSVRPTWSRRLRSTWRASDGARPGTRRPGTGGRRAAGRGWGGCPRFRCSPRGGSSAPR